MGAVAHHDEARFFAFEKFLDDDTRPGGAQALGAVDVTDISGTGPDQESTLTEIEGNRITGALICGGNTPPPTNDGQPNKVLGGRFGQCAAPGF